MTATPTELVPAGDPGSSGAKSEPGAGRFYFQVLTTVLAIVVTMVAAVAVVLAVATHLAPKGEYTVFGHPAMIVLSGSMSPVIQTGALIIDDRVSAAQADHLHVGQIVTFRESAGSATTITHRIVGVTTANGAVVYITKGDRNNAADSPPHPASDVVGVFSFAIPRGGYILNALHRPLVLGLLLASPIFWFIAGPLFRMARDMDEKASRGPTLSDGEHEADKP